MQKNKNIIWIVIVLVVIAGLVYFTINTKGSQNGAQTNMVNNVEGVKITVVSEGTGAPAIIGDTVSMNYTGRLTDGTAFDSNVDPSFNHVSPFLFTLGAGNVISGWDIGIEGMQVGEKRILEIAPEHAYGPSGVGEIIPPNSTLVFEVELVAINPQ